MIPLNGKIELYCQNEANPVIHSIQWAKDGKIINTKNTDKYTVIARKHNDGGIYTCQAFNLLGGGDLSEFIVTITEPVKFSVKPPPNVIVNVHENVEIECNGYGYPPPVQYWLRNKVCHLFHSKKYMISHQSFLSLPDSIRDQRIANV